MYHWPSLFASQANGFVQKLGHLLVVGVILPPWPAGNEPVVLQLGYILFREPLHTHTEGFVYVDPQGLPDGGRDRCICMTSYTCK